MPRYSLLLLLTALLLAGCSRTAVTEPATGDTKQGAAAAEAEQADDQARRFLRGLF